VALILALAANAALVAAFVLVAPASDWTPPVLLASLAALGLVGCFNSVKVTIRSGTFLDAEFGAALLAVLFLGPLPAMCVWLCGEFAYLLLAYRGLQAHLANVASYGWAVVAGGLVLEALLPGGITAAVDPAAWVAVAVAGAVVLCVNFAVTTGIVAIVLRGRSVLATIRDELLTPAPATALMIASGTATAFLYLEIGIPALALFSATAFLPRFASPLRRKSRPSRESSAPAPLSEPELDRAEAFPLYADRIAGAMRLDAAERRVVKDAASYIGTRRFGTSHESMRGFSDRHRHGLVEALLYRGEHWDGRGGRPGAVGGEMIPLTSRILAVAEAWARLTTGPAAQLTRAQALERLEAHAGVRFDPRVVAVAAQVVGGPRSCR
jgi:HD domain-containing protein